MFGVTGQFPLAVVIVVLLGVVLSFCGVGSQILIQTLVDDRVRGRVSSFWGMIAFGGTSLGSLVIGAAARAWGLQPAVATTGLVCAALAIATGWQSRAAR